MKLMYKTVILLATLIISASLMPIFAGEITLEECLTKADANYPEIKKYDLLRFTGDISLSDINKGWLPRVGIVAQGTVQNAVPSFPDVLEDVLDRMGQEIPGMSRWQYKAGVEVNQTIWDGGISKAERSKQRAATDASVAQLDVSVYRMHEKIIDLYFAILLAESQMKQAQESVNLIRANRERMQRMYKNGTATAADVAMLEAQEMAVGQQLTEAREAIRTYRDLLSLYIGEPLEGTALNEPSAEMPSSMESRRPELKLFAARDALSETSMSAVNASLMPKVGFFAQAYYGYPGFNYFESMTDRTPVLNALAGIKISWNIDAFYNRSNSIRKIALEKELTAADRELFLFNSRIQATQLADRTESMRAVMADDEKIVELRTTVREAAESKLQNGVIDATDLLSRITDENHARLNSVYHRIELLREIARLKYTLNNEEVSVNPQ